MRPFLLFLSTRPPCGGRRSYFQLDLAGSYEPGVLVIVISTTVLLVQHVKDRVRNPATGAAGRIGFAHPVPPGGE